MKVAVDDLKTKSMAGAARRGLLTKRDKPISDVGALRALRRFYGRDEVEVGVMSLWGRRRRNADNKMVDVFCLEGAMVAVGIIPPSKINWSTCEYTQQTRRLNTYFRDAAVELGFLSRDKVAQGFYDRAYNMNDTMFTSKPYGQRRAMMDAILGRAIAIARRNK